MTVDLRTLALIRRRIESCALRSMFPGDGSPRRSDDAIARLMRWMGPCGRVVTRRYVLTMEPLPAAGLMKFKRGGREL